MNIDHDKWNTSVKLNAWTELQNITVCIYMCKTLECWGWRCSRKSIFVKLGSFGSTDIKCCPQNYLHLFPRSSLLFQIYSILVLNLFTHFSWGWIWFEIFAQRKSLTFHNSGTQKYPKYKDHVRRLADMEAAREFLQNSTIHGLHHIASAEVNISWSKFYYLRIQLRCFDYMQVSKQLLGRVKLILTPRICDSSSCCSSSMRSPHALQEKARRSWWFWTQECQDKNQPQMDP